MSNTKIVQQIIMVNRVIRDDPGKGGMHNRYVLLFSQGLLPQLTLTSNREAVTPSLLWQALTDYDMWPIYLLGLTWTIPATPATNYLTLIVKGLGFTTFQTNLLTIPAYVLFLLQLIFWTWTSEKINNRFLIVLVCQIYMLPLLVALEVLPGSAGGGAWVRYVLNTLLIGYPYIHAILGTFLFRPHDLQIYCPANNLKIVALTSRNAGSVRTRTVGSAIYNMACQASNIIASNVCAQSLPSPRTLPIFLSSVHFIYMFDIDLPHRRPAALPHRQQSPARDRCLEHGGHHRDQSLLCAEK